MKLHRRRRESPAEIAAAERVARAQEQLAKAKSAHHDQARKREQESESVINRLDQLGEENHLAALVWDVVSGHTGWPA